MSTGGIIRSYQDLTVAQVDSRLRCVNCIPTENRPIDCENYLAETLTMWRFLVRCYVTLTSI